MWTSFNKIAKSILRFQFNRTRQSNRIQFRFRQLYGLPTIEGLLFALTMFVTLLTAATYNNNLLFACSFFTGASFFILPSFVYRNISSCVFTLGDIAPIYLGEKAICHCAINNPRKSWGIQIYVPDGSALTVDKIEGDSHAILEYTPQTRGYNNFPPIRFSTRYPTGIFRLWGWTKKPEQVLVYPKPAGESLGKFFKLNHSDKSYDHNLDLQYWQHREFQSGDNYSRVDWAKLAAIGKMYIREYLPTGDADLHFDLQTTKMVATTLEDRLSQLCLWLTQAHAAGLRYSLNIGSTTLSVDKGPHHLHQCLMALATHPAKNEGVQTA